MTIAARIAAPLWTDATPPGVGDPKAAETAAERAKAAQQFEKLMLGQLISAMRATADIDGDDDDDGGDAFARGTFEQMFDQAIADSGAGGLGLAKAFERSFGRTADPGAAITPAVRWQPMPAPAAIPEEAARPAFLPGDEAARAHAARSRQDIGTSFSDGAPMPGLWPVDGGEKSSGYGYRMHPIHNERRFHAGLDIAAPEGREIRAVDRGVVTYARRNPGYGNMVEITHADGIVTRYAHASRLHVREGDVVDVGEAIADVGSTGQSTGPHLHFEVRDKTHRLDPEAYLARLREAAHAGPDAGRPRVGVTLARDVK